MYPNTQISAVEAVEKFERQNIKVMEATPRKGKPGDKHSAGYDVVFKPLAAEHVMSAKRYADGKIVIVTIDGRRLEAR